MMSDCHVCGLAASDNEQLVHREEDWTIASPIPVPGWLMLLTNAHNEGFWELERAGAARFGELALALSQAVREVCGPERIYLMYAGENALHFHAMVVPRGAEVPEDWRGPGLIGHHAELRDSDEAQRIVAAVRSALVDLLR